MFKNAFLDGESIINERYFVAYKELNKIKAGITVLKPHKETRGHSHDGVEEVYFFVRGRGLMQINDKKFPVRAGDVVLIEDGAFHKVFNPTSDELEFVVAFNKGETV